MFKIELQTSNGDFVTYVYIPKFPSEVLPSVVTWGIRTFVRVSDEVYIEKFNVIGFTKKEYKEMGIEVL